MLLKSDLLCIIQYGCQIQDGSQFKMMNNIHQEFYFTSQNI